MVIKEIFQILGARSLEPAPCRQGSGRKQTSNFVSKASPEH